ncbi:lysophospholipid acyltransferase family protein [Acinetobacter sp. B10A]|uniref:lysophospholipid acyltransferase family protein n=1 Tax=Acinetobacter baretiae TaxID=2605383 RepID=UPI001B3C586A|nr:lysophospholipid acyltransferase family protein [Acinetobacter baretiae]MBF7684696.1 lysophospholipid acyltransferase family protein [Acinetobacter baretiae]
MPNTRPNMQSTMYRMLNFISKQPLQLTRIFARLLASITYRTPLVKAAQVTTLNINIALPEYTAQERQAIVKKSIQNELTSYFEFFNIWGSSQEKNIQRIHQVEGKSLFQNALAQQKGIILIVPHFGTWEIMNAWCAQYTQMTIMYKPIKNKDADIFVRRARSRENATLVPTDESGIRQVYKALKRGGTTVILPDHTPHLGGAMVDYFGVPLASSHLTAKLIQKTEATALFLYAIRNDNAGFDLYIQAMPEQIYQCSDNKGTQIIHQHIERLIQTHPEHYHWSYKRFKAHPDLHNIYDISSQEALEKVKQVRSDPQLPH